MSKLITALKAVASFTFQNTDSNASKRLCLFPGHFDTLELVSGTRGSATVTEPVYSNISHITDAGYNCDQVAYDKIDIQKTTDKITCTANSKRTKWADFLRYIQLNGLRVTKMRIKNLGTNDAIFNQEIEISASAIGGKVGSDFINLSEYVSANAYDRSFIDIDLSAASLSLDNTTLAFLDVPASANFSIQFTVEA
ncbi:MAG: hypothetical protein MJZ90_06180 [Bacteroidales bacterium]|nr:hypothetical protein [Bacteroidales bacterium]